MPQYRASELQNRLKWLVMEKAYKFVTEYGEDAEEAAREVVELIEKWSPIQNMDWDSVIDTELPRLDVDEDVMELMCMIASIDEQSKQEMSRWATDHVILVEVLHRMHELYQSMPKQVEMGIDAYIWGNSCVLIENVTVPTSDRRKQAVRDGIKWLEATRQWIEMKGGELSIEY